MTGSASTSRLAAVGYTLLWSGLWAGLMATALIFRPFLPVDETRYLAVAWEMWREGNFIVPHLNGEPYSHKPPFLFWLIHAGWAVFGVNDWWPRLVAPLFGLASLGLTAMLARRLWPARTAVAVAAPLILFASLFWTLFTTLTMFDMLLAFCTLMAMLGVVQAWQDDKHGGFIWLALAIGIGGLAKGPAILLSTLPVALLAPVWAPIWKTKQKAKQQVTEDGESGVGEAEAENLNIEDAETETLPESGMWSRGWKQWYAGIGFALLGGIAVALIWAIPAAILGGEEYRNAIFWGQSAGRMVESFAHARPWWWFLAVLPGLILPWTLWPASWRSIRGLLDLGQDNGLRFCLVWFLPALITFSAISGKQLHYLLPIFPALALMLGRLLVDSHITGDGGMSWTRSGLQVPGGLFVVFGLVIGIAPLLAGIIELPPLIADVEFIWGWVMALFALSLIVLTRKFAGLIPRIATMAILSMALIVAIHLGLRPVLEERFDLKPISQKMSQWQRSGIKLAFSGKYHGQFNFLGRLEDDIAVVGLLYPDLKNWLVENPEGLIASTLGEMPQNITPIYSQPFRGRLLVVINTEQALADPYILGNTQE